nr:immunoglobulin light chain junction region [Macaca mulatta]MOX28299.1 immunoglobulin light chain junction region [Macaca mulatta]MOX28337.1 immunoglobulin light chain junction region [Macaca mulatta]MOX28338.1 immunoglobulin light chain junction region [Macaca mulatta]MOX28567.1 immunoglobulin light chain junction region [Macaca mulatta]
TYYCWLYYGASYVF